jgi:hypothetical protein
VGNLLAKTNESVIAAEHPLVLFVSFFDHGHRVPMAMLAKGFQQEFGNTFRVGLAIHDEVRELLDHIPGVEFFSAGTRPFSKEVERYLKASQEVRSVLGRGSTPLVPLLSSFPLLVLFILSASLPLSS